MNSGTAHIIIKLIVAALAIAYFMMGAPAEPSTFKPVPRGKFNVLLITVDCLRPDHMGIYGYHRDTTPNIDRFFKHGFRFNRAYAQSAWTSPGVVSLLTGMTPSVHGMTLRGNMTSPRADMPLKQLQQAGWTTLTYTDDDNYANLGWNTRIPKGQLIKTLDENRNQRFFAWYHFRETHLPYDAPEPFKARFSGDYPEMSENAFLRLTTRQMVPRGSVELKPQDKKQIEDMYDAVLADQDEQLRPLFEYLEHSGRVSDTVVILTADHAEELMEHGWVGHASTSLHGTLYNETIHIPLLIRIPGVKGSSLSANVQQIDVLPTVFDLLGQPVFPDFQGRTLLPLMTGKVSNIGRPLLMETSPCGWQCPEDRKEERLYAVQERNHKLIAKKNAGRIQYELYDLSTDPTESRNLARDQIPTVNHLRNRIEAYQKENFRLVLKRAIRTGKRHLTHWKNDLKSPEENDFESSRQESEWILKINARIENEFANGDFTESASLKSGWGQMVNRARNRIQKSDK